MSRMLLPVFEDLPVEIHGLILREMTSLDDVSSTIRASPKALGSFREYRERVLIEVLEAHLPAEIFAGYLGLLNLPNHEDLNHVPNLTELSHYNWDWDFCKYRAWLTQVDHFLKTHLQNVDAARATDQCSRPKRFAKFEVNYMISIYGMLKRFVRRYELFIRENMTTRSTDPKHLKTPGAEIFRNCQWPPLSENETTRVHRAFLRFEIGCRLNGITARLGADPRLWFARVRSDTSLCKYLQEWEQEEIMCILAYVKRQYDKLARDTVEDFYCDVWRLNRKTRYCDAPDSDIRPASDIPREDRRMRYNLTSWYLKMTFLGLPLLQQVLQSGVDDQRRFFTNTNLRYKLQHYRFAFDGYTQNMSAEGQRSANEIYKFIDNSFYRLSLLDIELKHLNFQRGDPDRAILNWVNYGYSECTNLGLRQMGWVFWEDRSRVDYFCSPETDHATAEDCGAGGGYTPHYEGNHIWHYIKNLARVGPPNTGLSERFPGDVMYVTNEAHEQLMDKYAPKPPDPDGQQTLPSRFRAISEWSSKEVSPAFREICLGTDATE